MSRRVHCIREPVLDGSTLAVPAGFKESSDGTLESKTFCSDQCCMKKTIAAIKKSCSISELQTDWINLHDLERAKAVRDLHNCGISIRHIAAHLHMSGGSLRRLLTMLDAPVLGRLLYRQAKTHQCRVFVSINADMQLFVKAEIPFLAVCFLNLDVFADQLFVVGKNSFKMAN